MACGFDPDLFWRSTPRELALHFRGARLRAEREHEMRAWLAWHAAALPRARKFPSLDDMLGRKKTPRRQTADEIQAALRAWHERLKGT